MARPAGEYTEDIRNLLTQSIGSLTYGKARPLLEEMGWEIARKPKPKSRDFAVLEKTAHAKGKEIFKVLESDAAFNKALAKCRFNPKTAKAVRREFIVRRDFHDEANNFNVVKYNWGELKTSQRVSSTKPQSNEKTVKVAPQPECVSFIKRCGGVKKVEQRIVAMKKKVQDLQVRASKLDSDVSELESMLNRFNELQEFAKRIQSAA